MKKNLIVLLFLFSISVFSQFSKTHYIPPVSNSDSQEPQGQYMYISCPSVTPVSFTITQIGSSVISGTVTRDNPYVLDIGSRYDTQFLISRSDVGVVKRNKGYIVEANDMIYVNVRLTSTPNNYQAGGLVSKGLAALGTQFRIGAFVNTFAPSTNDNYYTFGTILATENNTTITFGDIKPGVTIINNPSAGNTPSPIVLNRGESYAIAVEGTSIPNRDGLIGASISSDKPIAVNCGSFAGSDGTTSNLDLGFDQIVSVERTGTEYIFIKGNGVDETERPLIVSNENNTDVFLNGSATPYTTLSSGQYLALDGSAFSAQGNLYIRTSKNAFAYQGIGGTSDQANQNMAFVPPLSCQTPKIINNIPLINRVGNLVFNNGVVCIVTEVGATLDFILNGTSYSLANLPSTIIKSGPFAVTGNPNFVTYTFQGLDGNISVFSSKQLYLSYFSSSGAATYGGFYSGFTYKPEVIFDTLISGQSNCIPNVELKVNTLTAFDTFQWYKDGVIITGATSGSYSPIQPGYYYVSATISTCGTTLISDEIPVSDCPTNMDGDLANDNIDLDNDNDGISNCTESYGDLNVNLSNAASGTFAIGTYSNSFTGTVTTQGTATPVPLPFLGKPDGSFITEVPAGKDNSVSYQINFQKPTSVSFQYVTTANTTDLINSNASFVLKCPINKTITVLNPTNQLLIDTNYDGIYESGVTEYSSFEIRFRLNSTVPLAAGSGTFSFRSYLTSSLQFIQKNVSDTVNNKATFSITATCLPKDSDGDGISDQLDLDSDNDGILDLTEAQGQNPIVLSNADTNHDGIDDAFGNGILPKDTDSDGIKDYLDLDSDNDGIYDIVESGSNAPDSNQNGMIDGTSSTFGANGFFNNLETTTESGIPNYSVLDTDSDGVKNYIDSDSDNDGCPDVTDAGFLDPNIDNYLGGLPLVVNPVSGIVTSGVGYTTPNSNYLIAAPITISTQPQNQIQCELQTVTFSIQTNTVSGYQWQVSTDGGNLWTAITNSSLYSGVTTATLQITGVLYSMNGYKYRVVLNKNGNSCGLISDGALLNIYALPTVTNPVTLKQCDDDTDGITSFNVTQINPFISANYLNETFTYFKNQLAANTNDPSFQINSPINYQSGTGSIWVRVTNSNQCFRVVELKLVVSVTQINAATFHRNFTVCDDYLDSVNNNRDGIATFNFSSVTSDIQGILPPPITNYTISYYKNETDALAEQNAITNTTNYRNIGFPNQQQIFVRVDSNLDNSCFGLGPFITLTVEALPKANLVTTFKQCDDNNDGIFTFSTPNLQNDLLLGQTNVVVTYFDANNNPLPSPFPATFTTGSQIIKARVTNSSTNTNNGIACYDETTIQFIVDVRPKANPVVFAPTCDDAIPSDVDGLTTFDTSSLQTTLLNGQTGMVVTYLNGNGTPLSSPFPPSFTTGTQNITAIVTNPINNTCPDSTTISFVVNPLPNIELINRNLVCSNLPTFFVTLNGGIFDGTPTTNYTYIWSKDGVVIPNETNYTLSVNAPGIYTVKVSTLLGCFRTRTITVVASDIAHLSNPTVLDLVDVNTVTINVTGQGNYEYSIDEPDNFYVSSNFFNNVPIGIHDFYINDRNGCGVVKQTVSVVGAPQFFTPNGDGFNDTWNIKGVNADFYSNSKIFIFDRFGKLLKQITPTGLGWDGTYNSQAMPADDYWFTLELEDGRSTKGHFALKR